MKPPELLRKGRALTTMAAGLLLGKPSPDDVARAVAMIECAKEIRVSLAAERRAKDEAL